MILIDNNSNITINDQLVNKISKLILSGALTADEKLPSVRKLALELSINPHTVNKAYSVLEEQGLIVCQKNKGYFVKPVETTLVADEIDRVFKTLEDNTSMLLKLGVSLQDIVSRIKEMEEK